MQKLMIMLVCFVILGIQASAQTNLQTASGGTTKASTTKLNAGEQSEKNTVEKPRNAESKAAERAETAASALTAITNAPDKVIPKEILQSAKCVVMIPGMKKAGFIVGGRYGRGYATCRTATDWSAPAPVFLGGGSYGMQIGGADVDVLLSVMDDKGTQRLLSSKFEIGVDASAAAGPIGRSASAETNWKLTSEILSYSRARGLFAGLELNGAKLQQDDDTTQELYGRVIPFRDILSGSVPTPVAVAKFVNEVKKDFREAQQ